MCSLTLSLTNCWNMSVYCFFFYLNCNYGSKYKFNVMSIIPVSYTHLDVYKRQTLFTIKPSHAGYTSREHTHTYMCTTPKLTSTHCDVLRPNARTV